MILQEPQPVSAIFLNGKIRILIWFYRSIAILN